MVPHLFLSQPQTTYIQGSAHSVRCTACCTTTDTQDTAPPRHQPVLPVAGPARREETEREVALKRQQGERRLQRASVCEAGGQITARGLPGRL
ncbi:hypothetical protein BaRGS_00010604 [Batillaria attramentaria]|uniref:Uncharacterized protein n=1 Tax=Batillaria attramentaria TaxID=370345 RepID=A0ABD0LFN4_9CAEN